MGGTFGPILLIGGLFLLILINVPVAYALGLASLATALYVGIPAEAMMLKASDGVDNFALLAIPFFVLAGAIMAQGGIAVRLVNLANVFVGFIRGGLAMVNILSSMFFGGISGSSVADTSSIGSIMIPMMKRQGYDDAFSVNVTISSSTQGIIIPPSHNAIIYAYAAGGTVSIAQLFLAGIVPGVMVGVALMILTYILSVRRGYPKGELVPLREAVRITAGALMGLFTVDHHRGRGHRRHLHRHRIGGDRRDLRLPGRCLRLSRAALAADAGDDGRGHQDGGHGDDPDRLRLVLRLSDDADADPGQGDRLLPHHLRQQDRHSALDQCDAAGARHVHGHGALDLDLHADPLAGDEGDSASIPSISASSCCSISASAW